MHSKPCETHSSISRLAGLAARSPFLTYEPYYGLKEKPFSLSADPRFLYKSRAHAPMFDDLRAGIRRREGIIVLTGEPGTGKTTLCRGVLAALDRKTFCTFVPDPFVSREDLLKMLLHRVRRDVGRRFEERPAATAIAARAQLSAVRISEVARSAAGVCGADHRRGAEPLVAAARGDPHPFRSRGTGETAAARARRPARASRQAEGPAMRQVDQRMSVTLLARGARSRGCRASTSRTV